MVYYLSLFSIFLVPNLKIQAESPPILPVEEDWWKDECWQYFQNSTESWPRCSSCTNYKLMYSEHGLCQDHLSCMFEECAIPIDWWSTGTYLYVAPNQLPSNVILAETVADVVRALLYAELHGLKVSVKTSGHSYTGSSNLKDSLLINMANFSRYAGLPYQTGVRECTEEDMAEDDNHAKVCEYAKARGKNATLRCGGGQIWDGVYRGVSEWNAGNTRKYHVVGGAAGTVSAAGGWLQGGGLSGTTGMRMYGFGADQVLQLEMVLTDGRHIRFMPSSWESNLGSSQIYPQTTMVEGQCNMNISAPEDMWEWGNCDSQINFEDLWMAVRGGGGGTYGIVTAVTYQLHDLPGNLDILTQGALDPSSLTKSYSFYGQIWLEFLIDFLFPENVTNMSNSCGTPMVDLNVFGIGGFFICNNGFGQDMANAWIQRVNEFESNLTTDETQALQNVLTLVYNDTLGSSYYDIWVSASAYENNTLYMGHLSDEPSPAYYPDTLNRSWTANLPRSWLRNKTASFPVIANWIASTGQSGATYVLGGNTAFASDGMSAINELQRDAGFLIWISPTDDNTDWAGTFRASIFQQASDYPGGTEYNHIGVNEVGPLRSNWSVSCPLYWSQEKKNSLCIPLVEAVWGTTLAGELHNIKNTVDPNHILKCWNCIGYYSDDTPESGSQIAGVAVTLAAAVAVVAVAVFRMSGRKTISCTSSPKSQL